MSNDALQELEVKVAFLEDALNKLSDEFYRQQKELEKLKISHIQALETIKNSDANVGEQPRPEDEVPPHY
ncbi:MAG: SlyX family protein [Gammaproteobacteria bacterium]|nr:SlyX family protein [Gammaproteobacteria bacterium]NNC97602.1 SlyX family protein [Gammaproteobacteria bacterium]NNM14212.1 SlyX family protein [Gammaproteobacteria bacterium]